MGTADNASVDPLAEQVRALREQVERLQRFADAQEITRLVMTYGPLVDAGDAEGTAGLWTEAGSYQVDGVLSMHGREAIEQMVRSDQHQGIIRGGSGHVLTSPRITVQGDTAEAFNHALLITQDGQGYRISRVSANRWRFARTVDGWRIVERLNSPLDGRQSSRDLLAQARERS